MQVKELGHIVLYVRDVDRSARFYGEVLGWRRLEVPGNGALTRIPVALFSSGRTHHELLLIEVGENALPVPRERHLGLYHFGLKVGDSDDELREARDRCLEQGVRVVGMSDHTVTHSLYIEDPDGNEIELYIDVPGVDWNATTVMSPIKALAL